MSNQTGWYQTDDGILFHLIGENMSDETVNALQEVVRCAILSTGAKDWKPQLGERVYVKQNCNIEFGDSDMERAFFKAGYVGVVGAIDDYDDNDIPYRVEVPGGFEYFALHEIAPLPAKDEIS